MSFLSQLKQKILQHPFLDGRLVTAFMSRALTPGQIHRFAELYYPHILRTRLYQANALGICPDEQLQFVLAQILYDEYGNGDPDASHAAQYRRFMRAVGADMISGGRSFPELDAYIERMTALTQGKDWLAAIGAVGLASEWPIPEYYRRLLAGLRTYPGITDDDLELFISHIDLDIEHSRMIEQGLAPYCESAVHRESLYRGVKENLKARQLLLDGLYREIFESVE